MFFVKTITREIQLDPKFLSSKMHHFVKERITNELEGRCLGKHGYVISILEVYTDKIEPSLVDIDTGAVNVTVKVQVILLRPFRYEVLDTVVSMASDEHGFFASVGPLLIFVSQYEMPRNIKFNAEQGDCWTSDDQVVEIREGSLVRLRIKGISIEAGIIKAVGTINEEFLGQMED